MRRLSLLLLLVSAMPGTVHAQASPAAAQRASLLGFVVPVVAGIALVAPENASDGQVAAGGLAFFAGAVLGPALGYWTGGAAGRGWTGAGIRAGLLTLMTLSVAGEDTYTSGVDAVLGIGFLALIGHGTYDVVRVRPVVGERQARLAVAQAPAWTGRTGLGLQLRW